MAFHLSFYQFSILFWCRV